jgi:hypothetical protein
MEFLPTIATIQSRKEIAKLVTKIDQPRAGDNITDSCDGSLSADCENDPFAH